MAARKPTRVVLNMAALNEIQQQLANGLLDLGTQIAQEAAGKVHYGSEKYGHVEDKWGVAIWVDGKKVAQRSADGSATNKPRAFRPGKGLLGFVGFGWPGRFEEVGTSDTPSHPFLTPAGMSFVGSAVAIVKGGLK